MLGSGLVEAKVGDTKFVSAALLPPEGDWGAPRSVIFSNDPRVQLRFHLLLDEGQLGLAEAFQPRSIDRPRALRNPDLMLQKFGPPHVGQWHGKALSVFVQQICYLFLFLCC